MDTSQDGVLSDVDRLLEEIDRYDLAKHVVELEAYGLTLVPPEKLRLAPGFVGRLKDAMIRTCEKRNNLSLGDPETTGPIPPMRRSQDLLEEDDVFVEAATNPVSMTLVRWLCGRQAILGSQGYILKGEGGASIGLHHDSLGLPPGTGPVAHMCNASWLCTDYASAEDGPTVYVPGSHKWGHGPGATSDPVVATTSLNYRPLIGKSGSLAIWNGWTWHGSAPRTKKGLRVTLVQIYYRPYMRTFINYFGKVSPQLLQKYPELEEVIGKPPYPSRDPQEVPRGTETLRRSELHPLA